MHMIRFYFHEDDYYCIIFVRNSEKCCLGFRSIIGGRSSNEALGNKLILSLARSVGKNLFQCLPSAGSTTSGTGEFTHVLTVSLDFFLLGINAGCQQFRRRTNNWLEESWSGGKCLQRKDTIVSPTTQTRHHTETWPTSCP